MAEALAVVLYLPAERIVVLHWLEHRARHGGREYAARRPGRALLDRDREARQVVRRGPQAGGSLLGIGVSAAGERLAVLVMRPRGVGRQLWRQWLGIGAGGHAQRRQHERLHGRVKWLAGAVDHRLLHHGVAAARVAECRSRRGVDTDRLRVGGAGAIEHLLQRWHALAGGVAGKARDAHATGVRQQLAQARHAVTLLQRPAGERLVDACVQIELALFDHAQRRHGRHGFAERGGLEQRLRRDGRSAGPGHAIAARPGHLAVLDHRHAHARHVQPFHFVGQGQGRYRHIG